MAASGISRLHLQQLRWPGFQTLWNYPAPNPSFLQSKKGGWVGRLQQSPRLPSRGIPSPNVAHGPQQLIDRYKYSVSIRLCIYVHTHAGQTGDVHGRLGWRERRRWAGQRSKEARRQQVQTKPAEASLAREHLHPPCWGLENTEDQRMKVGCRGQGGCGGDQQQRRVI